MDGFKYNPDIPLDRKVLARVVLKVVLDAGFIEEAPKNTRIAERVFYRAITKAPEIRVQVWTSVVGYDDDAIIRGVGDDSIKVCAVYCDKQERDRGIGKATRIHRTGTTGAIAERLLTRMREVYGNAARVQRCPDCGAPLFKSKKGNEVCAELCWKGTSERETHNPTTPRFRKFR